MCSREKKETIEKYAKIINLKNRQAPKYSVAFIKTKNTKTIQFSLDVNI